MKGTANYKSLDKVPDFIEVIYMKIEGYHYFTSDDIGLNIVSKSKLRGYSQIEGCLIRLIKDNYNVDVTIRYADSFGDFLLKTEKVQLIQA